MIVDAHVHMGRPTAASVRQRGGIHSGRRSRDMDRAGVDKSVIMPIPHVYDNNYVAQSAQRYPDRLIPWAYVDPWHVVEPQSHVRGLANRLLRNQIPCRLVEIQPQRSSNS